MKSFLKNFSSLAIAALFLLGILFLPEADLVRIKEILNFLSKSNNTAISFGYYLFQKVIIGAITLLLTILFSIAAHRAYIKHKEEKLGDEGEDVLDS